MKKRLLILGSVVSSAVVLVFLLFSTPSCGTGLCNGTEGTDANSLGVGATCANDDGCLNAASKCIETSALTSLNCLGNFKGGYCGRKNCAGNKDCPSGSACVAHTDGMNYCFLTCADKSQCNTNRSKDVEANCSSSVTFVDAGTSTKACIPPS